MTFNLDSGALCLDFANTVDWHASDYPDDLLHDYAGLLAWAEAAGILTSAQAGRLREMALQWPEMAEAAFDRAVRLRETIYRLFVAIAEKEVFAEEDLALLNKALSESLAHLQINSSSSGFTWNWAERPLDFEQVLWPVTRSAAELLIADELQRVRQCADDRGCGYLFVDTSRNGRRRWCSMESCGNRAKAQRHYHRQKKA